MNLFTYDEAAMLTSQGYEAGFIEDIEEGDHLAFADRLSSSQDQVVFWVARRVKKIPRYPQDGFGRVISTSDPNYLVQFIAVDDAGVPMQKAYRSGWACFIKREV